MSFVTKTLQVAALAASFAAVGALQAQAGPMTTPFGPANATINFNFAPVVTATAPTGTANLTGTLFVPSADLGLAVIGGGVGTGAGKINFSTTLFATVADPMTSLFSFSDQAGGFFTFNLTSIETTNYDIKPGSKAIALYLLGTMGDSNLNLTATPTSVTLTLNQTGGSGGSKFSASASLANPPAVIPEPVSLSILGMGLLGLGLARRLSL